jgi:hypothetical protein
MQADACPERSQDDVVIPWPFQPAAWYFPTTLSLQLLSIREVFLNSQSSCWTGLIWLYNSVLLSALVFICKYCCNVLLFIHISLYIDQIFPCVHISKKYAIVSVDVPLAIDKYYRSDQVEHLFKINLTKDNNYRSSLMVLSGVTMGILLGLTTNSIVQGDSPDDFPRLGSYIFSQWTDILCLARLLHFSSNPI